jgi:hypothetical protein
MITTNHSRLKHAINLTKEPPRSPSQRLGNFVILGRMTDKCRAELMNQNGEYHYDCPMDKMFLEFKGINPEDFKRAVKDGLTDNELVQWVHDHGITRSPDEIMKWSNDLEKSTLMTNPEKRDFFIGECKKLGLDPQKTTLFQWLDADDRASFKKA